MVLVMEKVRHMTRSKYGIYFILSISIAFFHEYIQSISKLEYQ